MRVFKVIVYGVLFLSLSVMAAAALWLWWGTPVSRAGFFDVKITALPGSTPNRLIVEGKLISSAQRVTSVSQKRTGQNVTINVRSSLVLPNSKKGDFREEIDLTDDVRTVSLGHPENVIWRR